MSKFAIQNTYGLYPSMQSVCATCKNWKGSLTKICPAEWGTNCVFFLADTKKPGLCDVDKSLHKHDDRCDSYRGAETGLGCYENRNTISAESLEATKKILTVMHDMIIDYREHYEHQMNNASKEHKEEFKSFIDMWVKWQSNLQDIIENKKHTLAINNQYMTPEYIWQLYGLTCFDSPKFCVNCSHFVQRYTPEVRAIDLGPELKCIVYSPHDTRRFHFSASCNLSNNKTTLYETCAEHKLSSCTGLDSVSWPTEAKNDFISVINKIIEECKAVEKEVVSEEVKARLENVRKRWEDRLSELSKFYGYGEIMHLFQHVIRQCNKSAQLCDINPEDYYIFNFRREGKNAIFNFRHEDKNTVLFYMPLSGVISAVLSKSNKKGEAKSELFRLEYNKRTNQFSKESHYKNVSAQEMLEGKHSKVTIEEVFYKLVKAEAMSFSAGLNKKGQIMERVRRGEPSKSFVMSMPVMPKESISVVDGRIVLAQEQQEIMRVMQECMYALKGE